MGSGILLKALQNISCVVSPFLVTQKHVCCDAPSEVTHKLPVECTLVKMILGRPIKPHGSFDRSCPKVQPFEHKWEVYVLQKYSCAQDMNMGTNCCCV